MLKNKTKKLLKAGGIAVGAQLRCGSPSIAELFGYAGFDFLCPDSEHSPQTPVGIQAQFQAIGNTGATPMVRVPANDPDVMRVYLDMGAQGVLAPFVNTAEDAEIGAKGLRYPPQGIRGCGPSRAAKYGFDLTYFAEANDNMLYMGIIEDARAIENIEEIVETEGVDVPVVGPVDLSISLGVPMEYEHPKFRDAVKTVIAAAERVRKPVGIGVYGDLFDPGTYERFLDEGFRVLLAGVDESLLVASTKKVLDAIGEARGA